MLYPFRLRPGSVMEKKAKKRSEQQKKKSASEGRRVVEPGPRLFPFIFI